MADFFWMEQMIRLFLMWLWTVMLSVAGAGAQYAQRVRDGELFSWRNLALDMVICVFVGIVTHLICDAAGIDPLWTAALVAISSHMGTRAAHQWERIRNRILGLDHLDSGDKK